MNLLIHVLGWTLLHFLWQGAVATIAAAAVLRMVPATSPRVRYAVASIALATMIALPAITATVLMSSSARIWWSDTVAISASLGSAGGAVAAQPSAAIPVGIVPGESMQPTSTLLKVVVAGWLAGVVLCLTRLAGGWWRVRWLHRASLRRTASRWQSVAVPLAVRLRLRRGVHIIESDRVDTPTLIGWIRPVILLPIAALANLTPAQVEAILAHELAHVRRHDYVVNLLQTIAETLLFYHPGVWWVSGRIRAEREHCCDAVAVALCGNAVDYAAALEELETWRTRHARLAVAATDGQLLARVRRVLHEPSDDQRPSLNLGIVTALVLLLIVVSGALQHLPASRLPDAPGGKQVRELPPPPPPPPPPGDAPAGWRLSQTANFEISYPPDLEPQVERVGREAEAAYAQIRLDLRHELAFKPRLVLFATRREMVRALAAGAVPGNAEHILLTLDTSPARLRGDVVHELSHVFGFDILPQSVQGHVPGWIPEGLAEHERGEWDSSDAGMVAEMVRRDAVPRISSLGPEGVPGNPRLNVVLGHAAFDFIVSRAGKDGLRQFLLALRKSQPGGLSDAFVATFGLTAEDFDRAFAEYLRDRFAVQ